MSTRRRRRRVLALLAAASLALALASCGGARTRNTRVGGHTLTIYSSLMRQGVQARIAEAVAAGEQLALADAHGRVGSRRVRLVELDDSDPAGETWDPSAVEANARRAVADPTTIAYIGELGLGGSAVSVPVTNDAGILQVSPNDGLTSLTRNDPGASGASGPERYYPSDRRSFLRLVPPDVMQADALVSWAASRGAHSVAVVQDDNLFARELASEVAVAAARRQLAVAQVVEAKSDPSGYPGLAATLAEKKPDAVVYTGIGGALAGSLLAAINAALPHAPLYGTSALASASPTPAGLPDGVQVLDVALPRAHYQPAGRRVLARLDAELGTQIRPEALYGYEAMAVVLDAIRRAGRHGNDRLAVIRRGLTPRQRTGVLGTYAISASGDTSASDFASYTLSPGGLTFEGIRAPG